MTTQERVQLAAATGLSLPTIIKWDLGRPINRGNAMLLDLKSVELGLRAVQLRKTRNVRGWK